MVSLPDTVVTPQVQGPALQGSIFGGHAPITGSHIYLLQPGTAGIGSPATSILGNNSTTSANGYALTANAGGTSDPNIPLSAKYVTSDSSGAFSLTGAYSCAIGQPVYIYAYGGTVGVATPTTVAANVTQIVVSNSTMGAGGTATYAFTVAPAESLTAGENVTISGLTGHFSVLNNTQTVLAGGLTTTTFSITATDYFTTGSTGNIANGPYYPTGTTNFGTSGTVTAAYSAIVQLATLGNCPSSGNFSTAGNGAISFVYMNEVSTVATAYTFQPFTSSANNSAWDIGSSGSTQGLTGIENAANTAAQLYNIQGGGQLSTALTGEGHIANTATLGGNGVVPQATIDTLANIVAACLDSAPATGGGPSGTCVTLFANATDNGLTTGANPTDVATAAINIARYPAGNHSSITGVNASFVSNLFKLPTAAVPYVPVLAAAPNDFTITIGYTGGGLGATNGKSPHSVAVDASGNIYTVNYSSSKLNIFSPLGVPLNSTGFGGNNLVNPVSVAVGLNSNHVWVANSGSSFVSEFTTAGGATASYPVGQSSLRDAEIDGSGNIWVTSSAPGGYLIELNSSGVVQRSVTSNVTTPWGLAISPFDGIDYDAWVADNGGNQVLDYDITTTNKTYDPGFAIRSPIGIAIDSGGDIWIANDNSGQGRSDGTISQLSDGGTAMTNSPYHTGGTTSDGIAIDGSNNAWVTDTTDGVNGALYELTNAGTEISPTTGNGYTATSPDGIAIDPSGNVWYNSTTTAALYEVVGAGAPVVMPLSYAVEYTKLGMNP